MRLLQFYQPAYGEATFIGCALQFGPWRRWQGFLPPARTSRRRSTRTGAAGREQLFQAVLTGGEDEVMRKQTGGTDLVRGNPGMQSLNPEARPRCLNRDPEPRDR